MLDGLVLFGMAAVFAVLFGDDTLDTVTRADEDRVGVSMTLGDVFARPTLVGWFIYLIAAEAL